jgi:hypothetical protein
MASSSRLLFGQLRARRDDADAAQSIIDARKRVYDFVQAKLDAYPGVGA